MSPFDRVTLREASLYTRIVLCEGMPANALDALHSRLPALLKKRYGIFGAHVDVTKSVLAKDRTFALVRLKAGGQNYAVSVRVKSGHWTAKVISGGSTILQGSGTKVFLALRAMEEPTAPTKTPALKKLTAPAPKPKHRPRTIRRSAKTKSLGSGC